MPRPVQRNRAKVRPSDNWHPNRDVKTAAPESQTERADKEKLIAEFMAKKKGK